MILHKVQSVEALSNFMLLVTFRNQEKRSYDVKPLFEKWDVFLPLAPPASSVARPLEMR